MKEVITKIINRSVTLKEMALSDKLLGNNRESNQKRKGM